MEQEASRQAFLLEQSAILCLHPRLSLDLGLSWSLLDQRQSVGTPPKTPLLKYARAHHRQNPG